MRQSKPFFKITFQDLEIAEEFFDNEKHFSEFILAVSYYYRGKNYQIKNKNVQKYFKTYQKTMDSIIESKSFGKKGAEIKSENQQVMNAPLEGSVQDPLEETLSTNNKVLTTNNKVLNINNTSGKPETLDFNLLIEYLNKKTGRSFRTVTDAVKKKYKSALKQGYTKEDIRTAIDNAVKAKNHIDNNFQYLTLEFFSRPEKLDMYSDKSGPKSIDGETPEQKDLRIRIEEFNKVKIH